MKTSFSLPSEPSSSPRGAHFVEPSSALNVRVLKSQSTILFILGRAFCFLSFSRAQLISFVAPEFFNSVLLRDSSSFIARFWKAGFICASHSSIRSMRLLRICKRFYIRSVSLSSLIIRGSLSFSPRTSNGKTLCI